VSLFKKSEGLFLINSASLLSGSLATMFESLLFYLFVSFSSIVLIIFFIVKKKIILALNFLLFQIAMILLYLSFIEVNIMHLFSMIVIVVAGIDYGIYMSKENSTSTNEAILYSLLTTFSGFGILVLSSIGAIHSIGIVITLGILSILFLVLFLETK
jgi:predicted exporter